MYDENHLSHQTVEKFAQGPLTKLKDSNRQGHLVEISVDAAVNCVGSVN